MLHRRETVNIKADNVVIMDISSNDKGDVQFRMYITISDDGSTVLDPSSIETCLIVSIHLPASFSK